MEKNDIIQMIRDELAAQKNTTAKTTEKAQYVAEQLLNKGIQPSWRLIREVLGTGSASTLQKVVNDFWTKLGERIEHLEKRQDLPKPLIKSVNTLWNDAVQFAQENFQKKIQAIEQQAEIAIGEAQQTTQQARTDLSQYQQEMQTAVSKFNQQINEKEIQVNQNAQRATEAKKNYVKALQENAVLQQQQQSLQQQIQHLQQQCEQLDAGQKSNEQRYVQEQQQQREEANRHLERQATQYESMLDYYGQEAGRLKGQIDTLEKSQHDKQQHYQQQHSTQQQGLADANSDNKRLQQDNKRLQQQSEQWQQQQSQHYRETSTLQKELAQHQAKHEMYQQYNQRLLEQERHYVKQLETRQNHQGES